MRKAIVVPFLSLAVAGIVGFLGFPGCGGDGGGGCGDPPSIAGAWTGTLNDTNCGDGTFKVTFAQNNCSINNGVWSADFVIPACDELGTLEGNLDDTALDVTLSPNGNGCSFDVTGLVNGSNQISGTYTPRGQCQVQGGGSFAITRDVPATATPGPTSTPSPTATPTP